MAPTKATKLDFTDREDEVEDEVDEDDFAADDDFADDDTTGGADSADDATDAGDPEDFMFGRRWTWRIMMVPSPAASNVSASPGNGIRFSLLCTTPHAQIILLMGMYRIPTWISAT